MVEAAIIGIALLAGVIFKRLGFPPLLGYLLAGFVGHGLGLGNVDQLVLLSDIGITLLLFTIGLKIDLKLLAKPQVWAVGGIQILIIVPLIISVIWLYALFVPGVSPLTSSALVSVAFALSFSSTVFAVKIFEERGENNATHARVAIGILVVQDLLAVCFLAYKTGMVPEVGALSLLLLPFFRPLFLRFLALCGHSELLALAGIAFAFGAYELFYMFNIKGDLGALIIGAVLAGAVKSNELYKQLMTFKDLFLVTFFVSIGYAGLPSWSMAGLAFVLLMLIGVRALLYFLLFVGFKMRSRTAFLSSLGLSNYSEFGLIVAALAVSDGWLDSEWLTTMAMAVALSYFLITPFNTRIHDIYARCYRWLRRFERQSNSAPVNCASSNTLVLGLGRVGFGAYKHLDELEGNQVLGIDSDIDKVKTLMELGGKGVQGDASDYELWEKLDLTPIQLILVSLSNHSENLDVVEMIHRKGFKGKLAVIARFPDEQAELTELGCITFNLYAEAGRGFAEHVLTESSQPEC